MCCQYTYAHAFNFRIVRVTESIYNNLYAYFWKPEKIKHFTEKLRSFFPATTRNRVVYRLKPATAGTPVPKKVIVPQIQRRNFFFFSIRFSGEITGEFQSVHATTNTHPFSNQAAAILRQTFGVPMS